MKVLSVAVHAALLGQALCATVQSRRPLFPALRRTKADLVALQESDKPDASVDDAAVVADDSSSVAAPDAGASADATATPDDALASADAGSDTFPALPAVSQMTGTSSDVLKALSNQAKILEAQVAQEQMENEAKLTREKAVFENKLKAQEQGNREVETENKQISKDIETLKAGNRKLKAKAEKIQEGNKQKREELQALHGKLGTAGDFVTTLLKKTFDSKKEKELLVLAGPVDTVPASAVAAPKVAAAAPVKPAHFLKKAEKKEKKVEKKDEKKADDKGDADSSDDDEDDDASDSDDGDNSTSTEDEADSFMEIASRRVHMAVRRGESLQLGELADVQEALANAGKSLPKGAAGNPKDLLNVLSSGVTNLAKAHKSSDAKLKALFVAAFKKGTQRHQKLMKEQQVLNRTRTSLQGIEQKLEVAVSHLEGRKKGLKEGLKSFGTYLQQLSRVALASQEEAQHLLKDLPKDVSGKQADAPAASADSADAAGDVTVEVVDADAAAADATKDS